MKIRSVDQLPEWFSLKKYAECASFGALEWYECLSERVSAIHVTSVLVPGEPSAYRGRLENIRENPLEAARRGINASRPAVRLLTCEDLRRTAWLDKIVGGDQVKVWEEISAAIAVSDEAANNISHKKEPNLSTLMISDFRYHEAPSTAVVLSLNATDAAIIAGVKQLLKQRTVKKKSKTKKRPAIGRWAEYGLLPYFDLRTWGVEMDIHIPERVMAEAIWPDDPNPDRIGDTVAKIANGLIDDLSPLSALAAQEAQKLSRPQSPS